MPYKWDGDGVFYDNQNDREVAPGEVVDLAASVVGRHDFVEVPNEEAEESGETENTYLCAAETSDGSICEREVDGPHQTCWDH